MWVGATPFIVRYIMPTKSKKVAIPKPGVQTYKGNGFHFSYKRRKDKNICIEDIAHALALTNRFAGHTRVPYSVAEHCVRASMLKPGDPLTLLLHDAQEAYIGDMNTTLKHLASIMFTKDHSYVGIWRWKQYEDILFDQIIKTLGVKVEHLETTKEVDHTLLVTEFRDLFDHDMREDIWQAHYRYRTPLEERIVPWDWQVAEKKFLKRYKELTK